MNEIIYAGKHLITFSVTRHAHSSWEFIYCTSGSGRLSFDGGVIPYQAGDLVLIPPFVYHQNESETGFTNIHLNMRDPALNLRRPAVIHDDGNHFILDAFTAAFYYFGSSPGKQTLVLSAYANLIVNLITDSLSAPVRNPIVDEIAKNIILSYPDENFELDQYLRTLPFNYDYLRKLFRDHAASVSHGHPPAGGRRAAGLCRRPTDEHIRNCPSVRFSRAAVFLQGVPEEIRHVPFSVSAQQPAGRSRAGQREHQNQA